MDYIFYLKITGILSIITYFLHKYFNGPMTSLNGKEAVNGKVIIVTGATAGIGKETALKLLENGAKVILACRDETKTKNLINSITNQKLKENAFFIQLDVSNFESIRNFVKEFSSKFGNLDILVNNAGGSFDQFKIISGTETTMQTNHIGPVYLTSLLMENNSFNRKGRIINVASLAHNFTFESHIDDWINGRFVENNYNFQTVYALSKYSNIIHAKYMNNLAQEKGLDIKCVSLHPGVVRTDFFQRYKNLILKFLVFLITPVTYLFFKGPLQGAQTTLHLCYMQFAELISGGYYSDCKYKVSTELSRNPDMIEKVMKKTNEIIEQNMNK